MSNLLRNIGVSFLLIALVSSCKTYNHSYRRVDISNKNLNTESVVVDIKPDFSKKVTGSSTKRHKTASKAMEEAYFNSIIENNVDVLVDPIYSVSTTKGFLFFFGGKSEATVNGYAGYYQNARPVSVYEQNQMDDKISKLEEFAKFEGIQGVTEEKTYTVNETCGKCKGNDALTLVAVLKNEEPLLEAKAKFDGSEVTSSTVKKQGFFGSSSSDSNSKKGILKRIMSLPSRLMFWKK
jgi:hypothetical protein